MPAPHLAHSLLMPQQAQVIIDLRAQLAEIGRAAPAGTEVLIVNVADEASLCTLPGAVHDGDGACRRARQSTAWGRVQFQMSFDNRGADPDPKARGPQETPH